jgi:hypothetical protein
LPSHVNIEFPNCNMKHSVELREVATYKMITHQFMKNLFPPNNRRT